MTPQDPKIKRQAMRLSPMSTLSQNGYGVSQVTNITLWILATLLYNFLYSLYNFLYSCTILTMCHEMTATKNDTTRSKNKKASDALEPDEYLEPKWLRCFVSHWHYVVDLDDFYTFLTMCHDMTATKNGIATSGPFFEISLGRPAHAVFPKT